MNYLKLLLPILVVGFCLTSCTKEDIDTTPPVTPVEEIDSELVDNILDKNDIGVFGAGSTECDCYGPFDDIDWENQNEAEVQAEVEAALASLTEEELLALFTPVCTEDGGFYANACFAECEDITDYVVCDFPEFEEEDWDSEWGCDGANLDFLACYDLNFPVTIAFADGSTTSANNMDEYLEAVLVFGENPQLVYPITLTDYETGEDLQVTTDEQLNELAFDCITAGGTGQGSGTGWGEDCIVNSFPITLYIDSEAFEINSEEDFESIIEDYIAANPDASLIIEIGFPMTLTFETGEVVVVNSDEEFMDAMLEYCE